MWWSWILVMLTALAFEPLDAVIVPGCPTTDDGRVSECQWRRSLWAAHLYETGRAQNIVVSGNAVHNRWVEADALAEALVALGVPDDAIRRETQALHSDQNVGYSLPILQDEGWHRVGVASDRLQIEMFRVLLRSWRLDVVYLPVDARWVTGRLRGGLPEVVLEPVPAGDWMPRRERKRRIAALTGHRRPPSWWHYFWRAAASPFRSFDPPSPPFAEPRATASESGGLRAPGGLATTLE